MNTWTIFKRELVSYFTQPTAYAIVIIFGLLSTFFAFTFGGFWFVGDASLHASFSPDNWTIASGYLGSFLVCLTFLAITTLVSAFTRDQVVALITSVAICCILTLCGAENTINEVRRSGSQEAVDTLTQIGIYSHFFQATLGKIPFTSLLYFFGLIFTCLMGTNFVLKSKRA